MIHFRKRRDVFSQPVPHSTDTQEGRPMVNLIKKKLLSPVEDVPGLGFIENACSQALLSSQVMLCGTII